MEGLQMKWKRDLRRRFVDLLVFIMIVTITAGCQGRGEGSGNGTETEAVEISETAAAETEKDTFLLYYYYAGATENTVLYMDIWNHTGLKFAEGATTSGAWNWNHMQAQLDKVEKNWYSLPVQLVSDEADGFDLYADHSSTKIFSCSKEYSNSQQYTMLTGGTSTVYAIANGVVYTSLEEAKAALKEPEEESTEDAVEGELELKKVSNLSGGFIMGMDISSVISELESGVVYKNFDGTESYDTVEKFCRFLAENGVTHIRVRVWNDPYDSEGNGYGGGNNDVAKAKTITDACRSAGLKVMVDFHCSDFWTDPGKQMVPKAWAGCDLEQKKTALEAFLTDSLNTIDPQKDTVVLAQVGNETTTGFVGENDRANMCTLFSAGAAGVRAYNNDVKVVIHLTNPESGTMTDWAKTLDQNEVDYDVLATSYYPYWHGTLANLQSELSSVKSTYNKEVLVAETSYAYTLADSDGHGNTVSAGSNDTGADTTEPFTVQGQAASIRNLIETVNAAGGLGVFYWEPAWLTVGDVSGLVEGSDEYTQQVDQNKQKWEKYGSGWAASYAASYDPDDAGKWYGGTAVDNEAMFYPDGRATEGLHVWSYVRTGARSRYASVIQIEEGSQTLEYGADGFTLPDTIEVIYNKGTRQESVTWNQKDVDGIDTTVPGTYTVNGTVTLSMEVNSGDYNGQTQAPVVYTLLVNSKNYLQNSGFESNTSEWICDGTGWTVNGEDPHSGSSGMHYWSDSEFSFTVEQEVMLDEAGTYTLGGFVQGIAVEDGDESQQFRLVIEADGKTYYADARTRGWVVWQNPEVKDIEIPAAGTKAKVRIEVKAAAGSWGTWDDLYLIREGD